LQNLINKPTLLRECDVEKLCPGIFLSEIFSLFLEVFVENGDVGNSRSEKGEETGDKLEEHGAKLLL
jgi:hypothetical protein